jgi:hypothetical protein
MQTIVVHIGSTRFGKTFDWANTQDTLDDKIVLTIGCVTQPDSELLAHLSQGEAARIKEQLDQLHLRKIDLASEVLVVNLTDYLGSSTLHELCYAYNQGKTIRWLEDWPMYCPTCNCEGPTSEHFFHTAMSLDELDALLDDEGTHPYLEGQIVNWYGQIVPVVRLASGEMALQVDPACAHCGKTHATYYAIRSSECFFSLLVPTDSDFLDPIDLCDADQRSQMLLCQTCANCPARPHPATVLRKLVIRSADNPAGDVVKILPVVELPDIVRPLWPVIVAHDFERLVLRQGISEYIVSNCDEMRVFTHQNTPQPQSTLGLLAAVFDYSF